MNAKRKTQFKKSKHSKAWLFALIFAVVGAVTILITHAATTSVDITIDKTKIAGTSNIYTGVTHTEKSLGSGNATAIANAEKLLSYSTSFQNQHIMGWGALNPEPSPGVYSWSSLDNRINLIRKTSGTGVITLCGAPDWMKGGLAGQTDWSQLEKAPTPAHYTDYANLAAAVAKRYPDVKYFQVWNELKGFYSSSLNRWDYQNYTSFYNKVYDAVKKVRPDAVVGGPYVVVDSFSSSATSSNPSTINGAFGNLDQRSLDVINYWLKYKHGADFISVDASNTNKDGKWATDEFTATQKFTAVTNYIRSLDNNVFKGAKTLPIWWSEWYANPSNSSSTNLNELNALMTTAYIGFIKSGASQALLWQPQGDINGFSHPEGLWTDPTLAGGGQYTKFYLSYKYLKDYFGSGSKYYVTQQSNDTAEVIATQAKTLIVNKKSWNLTVVVNGVSYILSPYEVRAISTP